MTAAAGPGSHVKPRASTLGVVGEAVVLQVEQRQVQIPKAQIQQARLVVEMDDLRADLER